MDVLVTLKVNDEHGKLLRMENESFSDDMDYTLDEFIENYGEHIEEYLLNKIEFDESDAGRVILRYHYLALSDELEDEETDDQDEYDELEDDDTDGIIAEYDDGVTVYDLGLTNERIKYCFGSIRRQDELEDEETPE